MIGTTTGWQGGHDIGRQNRSPARSAYRRRVETADRDGGVDRRGGMQMEKVSRIVTSGMTVWLAILAGMTVFL